jgi:subtilisin family serine protease
MTNLKPATPRRTELYAPVVCRCVAALVAASVLVAFAASAEAGSRRARLSSDLTAHLNSTSSASIDVIVTGSVEAVDRLSKRHGLRVKKFLSSGAVFSASKQELEALAQDGEFEAVSGNSLIRSHMAITTKVTGAQAAWEGAVKSLGKVDGSGVGVAILDSGIAADHPALANRVVVSVDFTDKRGRGHDFYGHGTHIAGIVAARGFQKAVAGADSGMAPAAHLINLKVLGDDGSGEAADLIPQAVRDSRAEPVARRGADAEL